MKGKKRSSKTERQKDEKDLNADKLKGVGEERERVKLRKEI